MLIQAGASGNQIGIGAQDSFVLSNVISGNGGNGITIADSNDNVVQSNYIGTDSTGAIRRANRGNGIQITDGAARNLIGGDATGGNDPTGNVFARPPQGNLISGNRGNGVLIDASAFSNDLSGNYIGTAATGTSPLGNQQDGVAIVNANLNRLVGTTARLEPFVYFNVVAGNQGNGLRITNSDDTIVWANFFGLGADNATAVPNRGDGLLVNGSSRRAVVGGEIPLGNVMSGNRGYGIGVDDTASGFVSFNSFVGQAAFGLTPTPNRRGGIRVTSSNPYFDPNDSSTWNRIRTSLIGGNNGNGIDFRGNAHGTEVTDTAVGTDYLINGPLRNLGSGIVVGGNSSAIAIGGFQPSIQQFDSDFSVHVGGNLGYGIVFQDNAHDCTVYDTRVGIGIGVPISNADPIPNGRGGVLAGWGTANITIGGPRAALAGRRYADEIIGNRGNGVTALFSQHLNLLGTTINTNTGSGLVLVGAEDTGIGARFGQVDGALAGNIIRGNGLFGLFAAGTLTGSTARASTITDNGLTGVRLSGARGITVGATDPVEVNLISSNKGWGILATGWSKGSELTRNITILNGRGEVNTALAFGLTTTK